jgi:hypothetical protein
MFANESKGISNFKASLVFEYAQLDEVALLEQFPLGLCQGSEIVQHPCEQYGHERHARLLDTLDMVVYHVTEQRPFE